MTPPSSFNGSSLALLGAIVAVIRVKRPIGGWLFYFFCQVFIALSLIALTTRWALYLPRAWNSGGQYMLYVLAGMPRMLLMVAIAGVCVQLLLTREWRSVIGLQYALTTYAFLTILKIQADILWFPTMLSLDVLSLMFPAVWVVYLGVSHRVRAVFQR